MNRRTLDENEAITKWVEDPDPKPLRIGYSGMVYKVKRKPDDGKIYACKEYKSFMKPFFTVEKACFEILK